MLATDFLLIASLLVFSIAWLWRSLGRRDLVLWTAAGVGLVGGLIGVLQGRWQAALGAAIAAVFLLVLTVRRLRGARPRVRVPIATGVGFILLTALATALLYSIPVFTLPDPDGPHAVGVRDFELTDHARTGVLYAATDEPRRLAVRVWYPAATTDGYEPEPYATTSELETTYPAIATDELGMPSFFHSHLRGIDTHTYRDAPVVTDSTLPVVFFEHGLGGHLSQNSVLMEYLASHGYVVFSVAHPYDAAPIVFADGDVIRLPEAAAVERREGRSDYPEEVMDLVMEADPKRVGGTTYDERFEGFLGYIRFADLVDDRVYDTSPEVWVEDVLFVEDALAEGQAPDSIADILQHADLTRVGHIGMSFGGSTAAALAYQDPRAAAAVNLDGSDFHHVGYNADIPVPLLMLYSDEMEVLGAVGGSPFGWNDFLYERFETAGTRDDVVRVRLTGVNHTGVTDNQLMTRGPLHGILTGSLEGRRALDIVNGLVGDFLDQYLRGIPTDFPVAQLERYRGDLDSHGVSAIREWWQAKTPDERAAIEEALEKARA
ncbi:MAG: hypothetical protein OEX04_14715 [Acidimicrobiia bacterium]|nr:hypothetical protein [Acidimicrobiia bacterium]MDH4308719.1 hypothetical protein [Acidimicrobiia bacterium]